MHGDPYVTQTSTKVRSTSQVQSVELEPHAQFVGIDQIKDLRTGRVMSLADAQRGTLFSFLVNNILVAHFINENSFSRNSSS